MLTVVSLVMLMACDVEQQPKQAATLQSDDVQAAVYGVMNEQEKAWNKGDVETFMKGYLYSDKVLFTGGKSILYGYNRVLDNYKKAYPGKAGMGQLQFENSDCKYLAPQHALVAGKWTLFREADTLSGRYTLVWQLVDGEWKIIADHSS